MAPDASPGTSPNSVTALLINEQRWANRPAEGSPRAPNRESHTPRLRGLLRGVRAPSPPRREQPRLPPAPELPLSKYQLPPEPPPPPKPLHRDAPLATVGLSLLRNAQGWWYVSKIGTESSAHRSGRIQVLDELLNVDDVSLSTRFTKEEMNQQLLAPLGTTSMLAFRRPARATGEEDTYYALELVHNYVEADTLVLKPHKLRFVYVEDSSVECDFSDNALATQKCLSILGKTLRKTVAHELARQKGVEAMFWRWRDWLSRVFVLRIQLKKTHVRRQHARSGRALGLWQRNAFSARRRSVLLKQAVGKMRKSAVARAWSTWKSCVEVARENKRRDARLLNVAVRLLHAKSFAAFDQWKTACAARIAFKKTAKSCIHMLTGLDPET